MLAAGVRRLRKRLDLRGELLIIFGALEIAYGVGNTVDARFGVVRGVGVLTRIACMQFWGSVWIAAGTVAVVAAVLAARRPTLDRRGYAALMAPLVLWSTATAAASLTGDYPQAWTSTSTWGLFAVALARINARCGRGGSRAGGTYGDA